MPSTDNLLDNLTVVLFQPKFAENVGSTARACANFSCPNLTLVQPQAWDPGRAEPLATGQGKTVLNTLTLAPDLPTALAEQHTVYGTTARTGGWRKAIRTPEQVAGEVAEQLGNAEHVAVVFGPEDRGLCNAEIDICGQLLTVPTAAGATSLNLSQAVLLVVYEWFKACSG
ncbi:MAG: RNA methyltransferase, partial [Desulfohalobium sp.]